MIRRLEAIMLLLALLPLPLAATVFSGEVQVADAQNIFTPPSLSSPVVLRYYVADGTHVNKGDVLLRIDAGPAETELSKLQAQIEQTRAKNAKENAGLELKRVDAELALADAQADRDTAAVDAVIPRALISALDYDRHQSEMQRTEHALQQKKLELKQAAAAVLRRRQDGDLELRKQQLSLSFYQDQVDGAVVHARREGTVIHGFDNGFGAGGRYEEGSTSYPGTEVGQVVGSGSGFTVRAWVLEPDRVGLRLRQPVQLHFDALPKHTLRGTIGAIAGTSASKSAWGDGRYVEVEIALPRTKTLPLRPGMSVRVDSDLADPGDRVASGDQSTQNITVDGEIYARQSLAISPPAVDGLWQMTVTRMAGDGDVVKKGDMLVAFDAGDVTKNLTTKQGELGEKQRKQEQLKLDLADRARDAELATAKARAEAEKARRKANQPKQYIARVDYQKLVIARTKADRRLALTEQREQVARDERAAEQRMADADVAQLQAQVKQLSASLAALTVTAPRAGIVLHQDGWQGGKVDVGTQIWRGQSVEQMPDLATLAVRAALPERDLLRVRPGQPVRVVIAGGGDRSVAGHIASIGGTVHSKSRVEAVPVVDLVVQMEKSRLALKPGQSVQVTIPVQRRASR